MGDIIELKKAEKSHIWEREEREHYVEPEWCSKRLFDVEEFNGKIHDPCCGFGRIVKTARSAGYNAGGGDIVDRGFAGVQVDDFLNSHLVFDNIVSNPPFDEFRLFAERALHFSTGKVAMIWLVRTLNAARWLNDTPLKKILLLTPRPSMPPGHVILRGEKPGGGKQDFCWLIWDWGFRGEPTIHWLHRDRAHA